MNRCTGNEMSNWLKEVNHGLKDLITFVSANLYHLFVTQQYEYFYYYSNCILLISQQSDRYAITNSRRSCHRLPTARR